MTTAVGDLIFDVEGLNALPVKAIVVDANDMGWQKAEPGHGYWFPEVLIKRGPIRLVWLAPEVGA